MRILAYLLLSVLFLPTLFADEQSFDDNPEVYRGAYYGHLITGHVSVEGIQLSPGESVVFRVSYVHVLKDGVWYRTANVSSKLTCLIASKEHPGFAVIAIDAHLSIDGLKVLEVEPYLAGQSDDSLPDKPCRLSGERELSLQPPNNTLVGLLPSLRTL